MSDIELACHTGPWGEERFVGALSDIERAGFKGIEADSWVVDCYEDRVHVFKEILQEHNLRLSSITCRGGVWPGMNLEEEVERGINVARFLRGCGATVMALYPPRPSPDEPIEDELDLLPAATAYGEIARRTLELGVTTCLLPAKDTCVADVKSIEKFVQMADPEAMKLCVDSGFLAEAKIAVEKFIKTNRKKIGLVHLRDMKLKKTLASKRKSAAVKPGWVHTPLGKGELDLETFVDSLLNEEFTGWAIVMPSPDHKPLTAQICQAYEYSGHTLDLVL